MRQKDGETVREVEEGMRAFEPRVQVERRLDELPLDTVWMVPADYSGSTSKNHLIESLISRGEAGPPHPLSI